MLPLLARFRLLITNGERTPYAVEGPPLVEQVLIHLVHVRVGADEIFVIDQVNVEVGTGVIIGDISHELPLLHALPFPFKGRGIVP